MTLIQILTGPFDGDPDIRLTRFNNGRVELTWHYNNDEYLQLAMLEYWEGKTDGYSAHYNPKSIGRPSAVLIALALSAEAETVFSRECDEYEYYPRLDAFRKEMLSFASSYTVQEWHAGLAYIM